MIEQYDDAMADLCWYLQHESFDEAKERSLRADVWWCRAVLFAAGFDE